MVRECDANLKDSDVDEVLQLVVFKLVLGESVPRPVVFRPRVWAAPSDIVQKVLSTNRHFSVLQLVSKLFAESDFNLTLWMSCSVTRGAHIINSRRLVWQL